MAARTTTSPLDRLAELDAEIETATQAVRDVQREGTEANHAVPVLRERLEAAYVERDSKTATQLETALTNARAKAAEPWTERIAATQRRVNSSRRQRDGFVAEHFLELLDAAKPSCVAAAEFVVEALESARRAVDQWQAESERLQGWARSMPPGILRATDLESRDAVLEAVNAALSGGIPEPTIRVRPFLDPSLELPQAVRTIERAQAAESEALRRPPAAPWRQPANDSNDTAEAA
jgi:hypothetical protein